MAAGDEAARCASWLAAEKAIPSEANIVPFAQPTNYWFGNGVTFNALYYEVDPFSIRSAG